MTDTTTQAKIKTLVHFKLIAAQHAQVEHYRKCMIEKDKEQRMQRQRAAPGAVTAASGGGGEASAGRKHGKGEEGPPAKKVKVEATLSL